MWDSRTQYQVSTSVPQCVFFYIDIFGDNCTYEEKTLKLTELEKNYKENFHVLFISI